jgi:SAM-dependent methyltransferase
MTHPDRLGMLGRLHGLSVAPIETARVLEIGCGEGYNLMALAAAYPNARLDGFDLAETAITTGKARAAAAGLDNVLLWVADIVGEKDRIVPGGYDYIIVHGVYAWVPEAVRDAIMALAARALAPHGIAYVSYNALPGGYFRMVIRDLLLHEIDGITDTAERLATARQVLEELAQSDPRRGVTIAALRSMAESLLEKSEVVLFHDELGEVYAPQSLTDVATTAARAGLRYLTDTHRLCQGVRGVCRRR